MMHQSDAGECWESWRLMLSTKVDAVREFSCATTFSDDMVTGIPTLNLKSGVSCILK